jgi:hypothetical protein
VSDQIKSLFAVFTFKICATFNLQKGVRIAGSSWELGYIQDTQGTSVEFPAEKVILLLSTVTIPALPSLQWVLEAVTPRVKQAGP